MTKKITLLVIDENGKVIRPITRILRQNEEVFYKGYFYKLRDYIIDAKKRKAIVLGTGYIAPGKNVITKSPKKSKIIVPLNEKSVLNENDTRKHYHSKISKMSKDELTEECSKVIKEYELGKVFNDWTSGEKDVLNEMIEETFITDKRHTKQKYTKKEHEGLKKIYAIEQVELKKEKYETILLYRGLEQKYFDEFKHLNIGFTTDVYFDYYITSWSPEMWVAMNFASGEFEADAHSGVVISKSIPVKQIFSSYNINKLLDYDFENEYIVMGNSFHVVIEDFIDLNEELE